ncbi:MAG: hypothetical protein ACI845_000955 [Gammaproteobacteria bacterium]|jgi:hypothetical protein
MGEKSDYTNKTQLISDFIDAGIAPESLAVAAATANRLCIQSRQLNGGALNPGNHIDYQHLFFELAKKATT